MAIVKPFLSTAAMLTLYHAIFQSHLQYGVLVWSSTFKSYHKKLIVLQNKALLKSLEVPNGMKEHHLTI